MGSLGAPRRLGLALLALLAQDFPGDEGDLDNRSILPAVGEEIERLLSEGDRDRDRGRAEEALRSWTLALLRSRGTTGLVAVDDRLRVGPREAVARRIASLGPEGRAVLRSTVEAAAIPLAETLADDDEAFEDLFDRYPGSVAFARAALRRGDRLLGRGEPVAALGAYRRAAACREPSVVQASLARRAFVAARLGDRAGLEGIARSVDPRATLEVAGETVRLSDWVERLRAEVPAAEGPRAGALEVTWRAPLLREMKLAPLSSEPCVDGSFVFVQTESYLHVLDLDAGRSVDRLDLSALKADETDDAILRRIRPAARDGLVAIVHGTPRPPHGFNVLALYEWSPAGPTPSFRLRWRRIGSSWFPPDGMDRTESALAGFVFTHTPLLLGERVVVGAQRIDSEVSSYLLSFDVRDGRLRFARPLCTGSPLGRATGGMGRSVVNVAGTGPFAADGVLFYGTNLGIVAAVDADDGACLLAYRTARRPGDGLAALRSSDGFASADGFSILPQDSPFLYEFARPDPAAPPRETPLLHSPSRIPDAVRYAGRSGRHPTFLSVSGIDETVVALDPSAGGRRDSLPLGPDETFVVHGIRPNERFVRAPALAGRRIFAASDRYLYAFDLERDLLLEEATPPPVDPATGLFEDGARVFGHLLAVPGGILSVTPEAVVMFRDRREPR